MSVKKIVRSPISLLGVIGIVPRAKIVYIGSSTYTSELVGTGGSSVTTTLRTDILNQSGNRYLKGWTTTSGSTTINYNRGASVTLNDGQTLTLYPVYYADAKIVYSGANRKGTASTSYTQTVHATSTGSYSATLNKTYFRKLYNLAPFKGWTTTKSTSASVTQNYADGASVTLTEGQTLTIYPIYTATDKAVNQGQTSNITVSTSAGGSDKSTTKSFTTTVSSYVSGYTAGDPYTVHVYGYASSGNSGTFRTSYKLNSGSYVTIVSVSGTSNSATKTFNDSVASFTITYQFYCKAGSGNRKGTYKGYVSKITIW